MVSRLDSILSGFSTLTLRSPTLRDDDFVDQLHHFATTSMLILFAAVTGLVVYATKPIDCYNYGAFQWDHYQVHVNSYCWKNELYYYPDYRDRSIVPYTLDSKGSAADLDEVKTAEENHKVAFDGYKWVIVIFVVQALFFKAPHLLWTELNALSGSNISKMVEMMKDILWAKPDEKKQKMGQVASFLERWLRLQRTSGFIPASKISPVPDSPSSCTLCVGHNFRSYLSTSYLVVKLVYLINLCLQFLILSLFLKLNFWEFGTETVDSFQLKDNTRSFPTVVLCHFQTFGTKTTGDTTSDTSTGKWVQCILNINLFLEKMLLVLWLWFLILLAFTILNLILWCFKILRTQTTIKYVKYYMGLIGAYCSAQPVPSHCSEEEFILGYLRNDGVFVLRILAINTSEILVSELVEECWERYLKTLHNHNAEGHGGKRKLHTDTVIDLESDTKYK